MNFSLIVLLAAIVLTAANGQDAPSGRAQSEQNKGVLLNQLRAMLSSVGGAARIYYSTNCGATEEETPLPFPRVQVKAPSKGTTGIAAVREIFANDKRVVVSEHRSGMIRVTIGQPMKTLLQTKIRSITFKEHEQYNGELAIFAILNSKEVETAMRGLGFEQPVTVFGGSISVPEKGVALPHLPVTIEDITMDEALDVVAKTFGGIVIYETCDDHHGKRLVSLDFAQTAEH